MLFAWKFVKKTTLHSPEKVDLVTGKAEVDALEGTWDEPKPRNILEKVRDEKSTEKPMLGNNLNILTIQ